MYLAVLLFAALVSVAAAGLLAVEAFRFIETRHERRRTWDEWNPRTLLIVPCKGTDIGLEENLRSLMSQNYSNYETLAVVDSEQDAAVQFIVRAGMRFMVSDADCQRCSGKVKALSSALQKFNDFNVYVFADSDASYSSDWLSKMVAPLSSENVGLTTTFAHFVPEGGFWSYVKAVWGSVGLSMMESRITRFAWGGSLAFRSEMLDGENMRYFSESVSDDGALTNIARKLGKEIVYIGPGFVSVRCDDSFSQFLEWSNRQTALALHMDNMLFAIGFTYFASRALVLVSSIALSIAVSPFFLLLLLPEALGFSKFVRSGQRGGMLGALLYFTVDFFYLSNILFSRKRQTILWRGRRYSLSPHHP